MPLPIVTLGLSLAAAGLKVFGDHRRLVEFAAHPIDIAAGHLGAENIVELADRLGRWYAGNDRIENQDLEKAVMRSALLADYFCLLDSLPPQPGPLGPGGQLRERFRTWLSPERLQGVISQVEEAVIHPALEACEERLERLEKGMFASDTTLDPRRIEPHRLILPRPDADWSTELTNAALADIRSEHENLPARVGEIYQKRWFPYLCLAFREELKTNARVSGIFVPMQIATGFLNLEDAMLEFRKENFKFHSEIVGHLAKIHNDIRGFRSTEPVKREPESTTAIPSCFVDATEEFTAAISRNFLFEFGGKDSDYVQLLSSDLRNLFFYEFNEKLRRGTINRLVISGLEGSGKTFNALLLSLQLSRESYTVYYCDDITAGSLTATDLRVISRTNEGRKLFLIDNVQDDLLKTAKIVAAISHQGSYEGQPLFLFLTQPLEQQTFLDTFGFNTPVVTGVEKLVDFERLVKMFLQAHNRPEAATDVLKNEDTARLSGVPWTYRNMAFWNEVLRSLLEDESLILTEERILQRAHSFLSRREPELFSSQQALSRLLPLFSQGIRVHIDYARELLGGNADSLLNQLAQQGMIRVLEQDWSLKPDQYGYTSALVVASRLHVTKAKLLARILSRYYGYSADPIEATAQYSERFSDNLHYTLATFHNPDDLRLAFTNTRIQSITRQYLLNRHVGRQLDFMVRRIGVLDATTRDAVLNGDVLDELAKKIADPQVFLVSKNYLLRSLYRFGPEKALSVFQKLTPDALTASFFTEKTSRSIVPLAKSFEILKNIYLAAPTYAQPSVQLFARQMIDQCRSEFIKRLTQDDPYFTQLHWLLKRLKGLGLDSYFLEGIQPNSLMELIRKKDTSIVEFSRLLFSAARTPTVTSEGPQCTYYGILAETLTYDDLRRICDNKRSNLLGLSIGACRDEFVAKAFLKYVDDPNFRAKVSAKKPGRYNRSVQLISSCRFFTEAEKRHVLGVLRGAFTAPSGR